MFETIINNYKLKFRIFLVKTNISVLVVQIYVLITMNSWNCVISISRIIAMLHSCFFFQSKSITIKFLKWNGDFFYLLLARASHFILQTFIFCNLKHPGPSVMYLKFQLCFVFVFLFQDSRKRNNRNTHGRGGM